MRLMLSASVIAILVGYASAQEPTPDDFDAQIAKLTPTATKDERLQVAKWLHRHFRSRQAPRAIPTLERLIQKDPEAEVRREAVRGLVQLVNEHDVPCPLGLIVALRDSVDEVRWEAFVLERPFKRRLADGALEALIDALSDKRTGVRSNVVLLLGLVAGKDVKARAAIEKAKADPTFEVRHTAHIAWFRVTDSVEEMLTYMLRVREEPDEMLKPVPKDKEEADKERVMRNLFMLGSAMRQIEWTEERPQEFAAALLKLLEHKSPSMRRGAADLIGASARKVEINKEKRDPFAPLDHESGLWKEFDRLLNPEKAGKEKPAPEPPPMPSKTYARLLEMKAVARLRYVATMDPEDTVRASAQLALKRFAEMPELLNVRPREVKP